MTQCIRGLRAGALAGVLAIATFSGCARAIAGVGRADYNERSVLVTVRNDFRSDVRVYVAGGGTRHRLGVVETAQVVTFSLPRVVPLPSAVRLEAIPLGVHDPYVTDAVAVASGQRLAFTVAGDMRFSTLVPVAVRDGARDE